MVKSSHLRVHPWAALAFAGMLAFVAAVVGWSPPAHAAPTFTVIDPTDAPDAILNGQCASTFQGTCTCVRRCGSAQHRRRRRRGHSLRRIRCVHILTIPGGSELALGAAPNLAVGDLDISTSITVTGAGADVSVIDGGGANRVFDVHLGGLLRLTGVTVQNGKADYDGSTGHSHGGAIHNHGTLVLSNEAFSATARRPFPAGAVAA